MPDFKTIKALSTLVVKNGNGFLYTDTQQLPDFQMYIFLDTGELSYTQYIKRLDGDLVINHNDGVNFIFDVNSEGEFLSISPIDYDFELNDEGELIVKYSE